MSIKKMSLHDALARVGNPRLRRGGAKLSASARDLIDAGLGRASNPKKKKKSSSKKAKSAYKAKVKKSAKKSKSAKSKKAKKGSAEAREMMARVRAGLSPTGGKKKGKSKKSKSKKAKSKSSRKPNPRRSRRHHNPTLALDGRAANGRKSRRVHRHRAHARRRHNPAFDVKGLLIQTGLVVAGAFAAAKLIPLVADGLGKIAMFQGEGAKKVGYAHLLGAVAVAAAGDFVNSRYGAKIGFDIQPATIAIAAIMAYDGLQRANIVEDVKTSSGTFALTGPSAGAAGTFALTGPSMSGALVLPNLNDPNAMLGTYGDDYGMGATVLANLPETNAMLGSIFDDSDSMHGTVFTAAELPVPSVAPHSVMQGNQVTVPQMC